MKLREEIKTIQSLSTVENEWSLRSEKLRNKDWLFLICSFSNGTGEHAPKNLHVVCEEKGKKSINSKLFSHSILVQSHLLYSKAIDTHTSLLPHSNKFHTLTPGQFHPPVAFPVIIPLLGMLFLPCIYKSFTLPLRSRSNITFSLKTSRILLVQSMGTVLSTFFLFFFFFF